VGARHQPSEITATIKYHSNRQTTRPNNLQAGRRPDIRAETKLRCNGNKGQPHNILHGSIESAIPENPLGRPKHLRSICRTSRVIGDFVQILGSKFWVLGGLNQKCKNNVL